MMIEVALQFRVPIANVSFAFHGHRSFSLLRGIGLATRRTLQKVIITHHRKASESFPVVQISMPYLNALLDRRLD
ncbi:hypothetical protein SUGI_0776600 [Cryptomeria japonica]|nr:hypothetical protein SUGI_0776600 [Cryptomeria japonica]